MKRFILLTFAILAWAFWELSGGTDFAPEVDPDPVRVAQAQPADPSPVAPESDPVQVMPPEPERLSTPQPDPAPQPEATAEPESQTGSETITMTVPVTEPGDAEDTDALVEGVLGRIAQETAQDGAGSPEAAPRPEPRPEDTTPEQPADPAPEPEPASTDGGVAELDIRVLDASSVNLRGGPGTDFRAVDQLSRGTVVEVVETGSDGDEPWVRLIVPSTGMEGWMAARFLVKQ